MADILLADDDEALHPLIASVLHAAGHALSFASNGKAAYDSIRGGAYDLVILDHDMPVKTGIEVLNQLKIENVAIPPVIMLTARGEPDIVQACIQAGAKDFIVKPFNVEEVARRVGKHLGLDDEEKNKDEDKGADEGKGEWPIAGEDSPPKNKA